MCIRDSTHACGQAQNGGLQHAAHTVALGTGGTDGDFHGFLHTAVQQGKALGLVQQCLGLRRQRGGIIQRKGGIADPGTCLLYTSNSSFHLTIV